MRYTPSAMDNSAVRKQGPSKGAELFCDCLKYCNGGDWVSGSTHHCHAPWRTASNLSPELQQLLAPSTSSTSHRGHRASNSHQITQKSGIDTSRALQDESEESSASGAHNLSMVCFRGICLLYFTDLWLL